MVSEPPGDPQSPHGVNSDLQHVLPAEEEALLHLETKIFNIKKNLDVINVIFILKTIFLF